MGSFGVLFAAAISVSAQASTTQVAFFDSGGHRMRYAMSGEGETLVLLHGWMGEASTWGPGTRAQPQLRAPAGFRVVALDLRGHGESAKPHDESQYGAELARDVIRLLDHLKVERAHLLGYSMGAYVAGKAVDLAPQRVASVVYGGSSPVLSSRAVKGFGLADTFDAAVRSGDLGRYILDTTPSGANKPTPEQAKALADAMFRHQDPKALAAVGRSFPKLEVDAARMGRLKVPALFIYGSAESQFVLDRIAEAREALPHAEFRVIEGATHMTTLRSPEFSKTAMAFVERHRGK